MRGLFVGSTGAAILTGIVAVSLFWVGSWMLARPAYWNRVAQWQQPSQADKSATDGPLRWRIWGGLVIVAGLVFAGYAVWSLTL